MGYNFLKWAGGKNWLVNSNKVSFPKEYNRYIEPFLGGGSVFFHLKPEDALLSDINNELICTYISVRDEYEKVYKHLSQHKRMNSREYYYTVRSSKPRANHTIAARMIYLNKTCFNGIYRVNKNGEFNVPYGIDRVLNFDKNKLRDASNCLTHAEILCQDFEDTINNANNGDFLFCDPPYAVIDENNRFIGYNAELFTWSDQERLANCLIEAKDRGVIIMMTNVDHPKVRSLYENIIGFNLKTAERKCVLSAKGDNRKIYKELIVTANY